VEFPAVTILGAYSARAAETARYHTTKRRFLKAEVDEFLNGTRYGRKFLSEVEPGCGVAYRCEAEGCSFAPHPIDS